MAQHMGGEAITGKEVPPMPIRWSAWAVYETYDTSDGDKVFIGITSDNHWWRFCEHFDRPDMLNDPTLATNEDRVAARGRDKQIGRATSELQSLIHSSYVGFCLKKKITQ